MAKQRRASSRTKVLVENGRVVSNNDPVIFERVKEQGRKVRLLILRELLTVKVKHRKEVLEEFDNNRYLDPFICALRYCAARGYTIINRKESIEKWAGMQEQQNFQKEKEARTTRKMRRQMDHPPQVKLREYTHLQKLLHHIDEIYSQRAVFVLIESLGFKPDKAYLRSNNNDLLREFARAMVKASITNAQARIILGED